MDQQTIREFNQKLYDIFSNGKGEVGLEIGVDPGLKVEEYIQVPRSMLKSWCAKIDVRKWNDQNPDKRIRTPIEFTPDRSGIIDYSAYGVQPGWISTGKIRLVNGQMQGVYAHSSGDYWVDLAEFHIDPPNVTDMRNFYAANVGHCRDVEFDRETLIWIQAVRFWSLAAGLVVSDKSHEYVVVDDPKDFPAETDEFVEFAMNYSANAWTACAARATSWRKSNHATGGDILTGFPRRWCQKEGYLKQMQNRQAQRENDRMVTSAFYVATHATSVHSVLALMASSDEDHWSIIDPSFGLIRNWEVGESTVVRMTPKTQIAGAALVIDAMVVLRMMVSEGLAPMLVNISQIKALKDAEDTIKAYGMRCAVYSKWFFDGHPEEIRPVTFSQRSETFFDLATELAIIGTKFYLGSTISESPTLANIVRQSNNEHLKVSWAQLAANRRDSSAEDMSKVLDMVKSGSSAPIVASLLSPDFEVRETGITAYNARLRDIAYILGIPVTNEIRVI